MKAIIVFTAFLMVVGCRSTSKPDSLPKAKSKADLILLCSATHSGKETEYKMIRSLYSTKAVTVPYQIGDVIFSSTRYSPDPYTHDSALIFYVLRGGKLEVDSENFVYGNDVPAFKMTLDGVVKELNKP